MKHRPCPPLKWANAVGTSAKYEKYTKKSHKYIVTVDDCRMDTAQRPTQGLRRSCRRCRPWDLQDESTSATKKTKMSDTWKKNIKNSKISLEKDWKGLHAKDQGLSGTPKKSSQSLPPCDGSLVCGPQGQHHRFIVGSSILGQSHSLCHFGRHQ